MATEKPTTDNIEPRLLGRQFSDMRLRLGGLEGAVNAMSRDVKVLLVMAQNQDEAMKELHAELREAIGVISGRLAALEER